LKQTNRISIEVRVFGIIIDETTKTPVMILKAVEGSETLSIQIGFLEAGGIASTLEGVKVPRPMTHDLMREFIEILGGKITKVEVCDLRDNTFFANIYLELKNEQFMLDARPSDAIAIALRTKAKIFVRDEVFRKADPQDYTSMSKEKWLEILRNLSGEISEKKVKDEDIQ
jgi:bifunctional DNase/RNase